MYVVWQWTDALSSLVATNMYMLAVLSFLQYILQNILRMPRIVEPSKHLLVELRFLWDGYTWSKSRDVIVMGEQKSNSCISFFGISAVTALLRLSLIARGSHGRRLTSGQYWRIQARIACRQEYKYRNNFGSETVETIGCKVDLKTFWSPGHEGQVEIVHLVNDQNKLP